ncbi:hypothetical protein MUGA111182_19460 [Mucilaginibacter galii]|uniref:WG repeat-containing protein n=1 Tax=Mucilaginibacter galii TaxID=2005073 RepID=A0A917N330_9SPHI|nr:hypothetical protein [Mucilaginibacter galii]GGI52730.1 hypothetical protein GCM10011425_39420 [Mucilaginibacter galii]
MKVPALKSEETFPVESNSGMFSIIKIIPLPVDKDGPFVYELFRNDVGFFYIHEPDRYGLAPNTASSECSQADSRGRILFDTNGYWIYDGSHLDISEQEQLAAFIANFNSHQSMNNHKDDRLRYL